MNKTVAILVICAVFLGLVYLAEGQNNFGNFDGYPGRGGFPGFPGGGGGYPGYPGHGGGYPGGRYCRCRRYCFRGERYAGRCRRPQWRRHYPGAGFRRRLVRCCPIYGPYSQGW